jgi:hypothetical protein
MVKCWCYHLEGCTWRRQCNVELGYQVSICSSIEENHGKPWSSWPVAGTSGCKLTSSRQSGTKHANPNVSPFLGVALVEKKCTCMLLQTFLFMCILWMSIKLLCTKFAKKYMPARIYIYLYLWLFEYWWIWISSNVMEGNIGFYMRFVVRPVTEDCLLQFIVHLRFSFPPYCPA